MGIIYVQIKTGRPLIILFLDMKSACHCEEWSDAAIREASRA